MTEARRYEPLLKIASGGTAAVYVGTAAGALGFRQLVAIKIPHAHLADDGAFRAALLEEAGIAARLHHANVVDVRDVEVDERGIQLVMDYVEGASLSELIRAWNKEPPARPEAVAIRIVLDACEGLRALHELTDEHGAPLGLVHRDVSPANVLVGLDGVARIADFGLAKSLLAVDRTTSEGTLRGKLGYLAPEYVRGKPIDQRLDVFAMGVVLWEALAQRRLFRGESDGETLEKIQRMDAPPLSSARLDEACSLALDAVIARALTKDRDARTATVAALASDLERVVRAHDLAATHGDVRDAFAPSQRALLDDRRRQLASATSVPPPSFPPPPTVSAVTLPAARSRVPLVAAAFTIALVAVAATVLATRTRPRPPSDPASASAVAAESAAASESAVAPPPLPSLSLAPSPLPSPLPSAAHAHLSHPPHPTEAEPGKKAPRPNPYAPSTGPR